jgi:hypothetical protein
LNQAGVGFGKSKIYYDFNGSNLEIEFLNSNVVLPISHGLKSSYSNYFRGDQEYTGIKHYSQIKYENIYEGIDLVYKMTGVGLKYDFIVGPFADINQIQISYNGIEKVEVSEDQTKITTSSNVLIDKDLKIWYAETKKSIKGSFRLSETFSTLNERKTAISFDLQNNYDQSKSIVIDPLVMTYSTFLGGSDDESSSIVQLDNSNNMYIAALTSSSDFVMSGGYNSTYGGNTDVVISKISADGSSLLFSTFFGGSETDVVYALELDDLNNIYFGGRTESANFPTKNAYNDTYSGNGDGFLTKLAGNGTTLFYSTFIGGSEDDWNRDLALDDNNNVYLATFTGSSDFLW